MADPVAAHTWRRVEPRDIERGLAVLWGDLAQDVPITRAVLANLVVFYERSASGVAQPADDRVQEVVRRHPSRVVALHHKLGSDHPSLLADIGVVTFCSAYSCYGVEQIAVRCGCAERSLPSIVRRLTLGDMPTTIWWREDLVRVPPLEALAAMGRQFVYDSRQWTDVPRAVLSLRSMIEAARGPELVDLNWRRLSPVRRALGHVIDRADRPADPLEIYVQHARGQEALAWLLAGWLDAEFAAPLKARVWMEGAETGDDLLSVSVKSTQREATAVLTACAVRVGGHNDTAGFTISAPREQEADAVAAELRSLAPDLSHRAALGALVRRFSADGPAVA